jgi:polysaccharide pyruvyl transferase WcaK-like protein
VNVGVLGWWRCDNQGDIKILESMTRALAPHRLVPIDLPFVFNEDWLQRLNLLDFLILGGGGLFQGVPPSPFDTFDRWGTGLETPIGVAGLGIDGIPPEYRSSIAALVDQARFFYVRDPLSRRLVEHPKVQVSPDLTFLYPLNIPTSVQAQLQQPPVCGVNLRQGHGLEIDRWVETLRDLPLRLRGIPFSTFDAWQEARILRQLDETCAAAFSPDLYKGLDLMLGTAFHSVVYAIQANVPVIAIAYAPKVRHLMTEIGLEDYVLWPGEWHRLPGLVGRALAEHGRLVRHLQETTAALAESARQAVADIREKVEMIASPRDCSGLRASMVVVGTGSDIANRTTLESCVEQTYRDVEVIFVGDAAWHRLEPARSGPEIKTVPGDPSVSLGERLNRAFACATGEYLSWTVGGNIYAQDAIACMVERLERDPGCDMVYTDYYTIRRPNLIADVYPVDSAHKLFRKNVIGPCFLYRRRLTETVGSFGTDTPLAGYDYWLRAQTGSSLRPMHTQLFFAMAPTMMGNDHKEERHVRHRWRSTRPWPVKAFWRIVDTDLVENWIIRPLLAARRRTVAILHDLEH